MFCALKFSCSILNFVAHRSVGKSMKMQRCSSHPHTSLSAQKVKLLLLLMNQPTFAGQAIDDKTVSVSQLIGSKKKANKKN